MTGTVIVATNFKLSNSRLAAPGWCVANLSDVTGTGTVTVAAPAGLGPGSRSYGHRDWRAPRSVAARSRAGSAGGEAAPVASGPGSRVMPKSSMARRRRTE